MSKETIGSFTIVKDEILWIRAHLENWLPYLDQMSLFDGNSTDGTLEVIKEIRANHPDGHKITLVENQDPKDLKDDYVRVFNDCINALKTDLAMFLHIDMALVNPEAIKSLPDGIAFTSDMTSFAGDPGGKLYRMAGDGRAKAWKHIYRKDLGLHYYGHYGTWNEDCYFKDVTGDTHEHHGHEVHRYPYAVPPSGLKIYHFSDVRPYERRLGRMMACLRNQQRDWTEEQRLEVAEKHPRVTLKDTKMSYWDFRFEPVDVEADETLRRYFKTPARTT